MDESTRIPRSGRIVRRSTRNDEDPENSPESAGLVRGLARSAVSKGAGRIAVGRLPLRPEQIVATKTRVATRGARMARIRRVAKVSDRASTGLDFVEAHQESSTDTPKKESYKIRATNFLGSLAKNTILGMAVFATYEEAIDRFEITVKENQVLDLTQTGEKYETRHLPQTQLWHHYLGGFCAGSIHAGLGVAIESMMTLVWQPFQHRYLSGASIQSPALAAATNATTSFIPSLLHQATSHAVLFGSYETVKRMATLALVRTTNTSSRFNAEADADANGTEQAIDDNAFLDGQLIAVALAGGTAGICQQFVSDMAEQTIQAQQEIREKGTRQQSIGTLLASTELPRYTPRSLLMLSIPTSIGFVAFEYGREAVLAD